MSYQYKSLSSSNNEIRLLRLLPAEDPFAPIACELEIISLNNCPAYSALSYCWGDIPSTEIICLHGYDHEVTGNLHAALSSLRDKTTANFWWIDALCINQQDVEERSLQVLRMTSIYRTASRVVAWIGPATPGKPDLKSLLEFAVDGRQTVPSGEYRLGRFHGIFDTILSRKYWRRMWMVQEVSVAIDLWIVCGDSWVDWNTFCEAFDACEHMEIKLAASCRSTRDLPLEPAEDSQSTELESITLDSFRNLEASANAVKTFRAFRERIADQLPLSLIDGLEQTASFFATDDRDRIYALLGLVHDGRSYVPLPDYTISFAKLQSHMARNYLQSTRNLDIILIPGSRNTLDGSVPSWTPNWLDLGLEFWYAVTADESQKFKAAGKSIFRLPYNDQNTDSRFIRVECMVFAEVDGLSSLYGRSTSENSKDDHFVQPTSNSPNPYGPKDISSSAGRSRKTDRKIRVKTIRALYDCLDLGPELIADETFIEGMSSLFYGRRKSEMLMYLYYGVATPAEIEVGNSLNFYNKFWRTNRYRGKRRYNSPQLHQWLEDNRDWVIHGSTLESLCKTTQWTIYPGLWLGPLYLFAFAHVMIVVSIFGLILNYARVTVTVGLRECWWSVLIADLVCFLGTFIFSTIYFENVQHEQAGFLRRMDKNMIRRSLRLATTKSDSGKHLEWEGLIAMVPGKARRGDKFAILKGCSTPVLLRECGDGYQVLGIVYLDKAMNGELMEKPAGTWQDCNLY